MKKNIIIIILSILVVGLSSYIIYDNLNNNDNDVIEEIKEKESDEIVFSYEDEVYEVKNNLGNVIGRSRRTLPVLKSAGNEVVANKIIDSLTKKSNIHWEDIKKSTDEGSLNFQHMEELNPPIGVNCILSTSTQSDKYISFKMTTDGSVGGVGWNGEWGYNYDKTTGDLLYISDITNEVEEFKNVIYNYVEQYIINLEDDSLNDDWKTSLKNNMFNEDSWYFTSSGLRICIEKYILGPGAFGNLTIDIPSDIYKSYLK